MRKIGPAVPRFAYACKFFFTYSGVDNAAIRRPDGSQAHS
jgi:hypothetical protein